MFEDVFRRVGASEALGGFPHQHEAPRRRHEFGDGLRECIHVERSCLEAARRTRFLEGPRVRGLVVVCGEGVGHEQRGHPGERELGDGQRSRPTDREVRPRVSLRHLVLERDDLRRQADLA